VSPLLHVAARVIGVADWSATPMAKPGVVQGLGATRPARCYGRHLTLPEPSVSRVL
jgi:hypothetical protein